jgi:hypothetical protein
LAPFTVNTTVTTTTDPLWAPVIVTVPFDWPDANCSTFESTVIVSVLGKVPEPVVSGTPLAVLASSQKFPLEQLKKKLESVELLIVKLADGKLLGVTVE